MKMVRQTYGAFGENLDAVKREFERMFNLVAGAAAKLRDEHGKGFYTYRKTNTKNPRFWRAGIAFREDSAETVKPYITDLEGWFRANKVSFYHGRDSICLA